MTLMITRPHPWWRNNMDTFSALLALCAGNPSGPVIRSFGVFVYGRLNKLLTNSIVAVIWNAMKLMQHLSWFSRTFDHSLSVVLYVYIWLPFFYSRSCPCLIFCLVFVILVSRELITLDQLYIYRNTMDSVQKGPVMLRSFSWHHTNFIYICIYIYIYTMFLTLIVVFLCVRYP